MPAAAVEVPRCVGRTNKSRMLHDTQCGT